jgi:hypothetical protein
MSQPLMILDVAPAGGNDPPSLFRSSSMLQLGFPWHPGSALVPPASLPLPPSLAARWKFHLAPTVGGSSSIIHAFSSMFVHLPLVPAWLCLRCWRKWSARKNFLLELHSLNLWMSCR